MRIASGKYGPGVRSRHGLVYDRSAKAAVLFGGVIWTPEWNLQADTWELRGREWSKIRFGDAWLFRHNTWKQMAANFETDPRDDHGFEYHQDAKRMVMLEGVAGKRGILVRNADGWQSVEANPLHPRHQCSPLVWDTDLGGLLLHGGEAHHQGPQFDTTLLLRMPSAS